MEIASSPHLCSLSDEEKTVRFEEATPARQSRRGGFELVKKPRRQEHREQHLKSVFF